MNEPRDALAQRHLRFGWYALFAFASLGGVLETLHALKAGWYLDVDNETRRLLWRLAHAHGTLLALVNLGFASTLPRTCTRARPRLLWASACLIAASCLLPAGFLLGGAFASAADPGLPVLLVPLGLPLLLAASWWTARSIDQSVSERPQRRPP